MRRRKWIKPTLLSIAALLALTAGVSYWAFKGTPGYYRDRRALSPQERAAAAQRADNKLIETRNWIAKVRADERRAVHAAASGATQPTTGPSARPFTVTFTEPELNAFLDKWSRAFGWEQRYARYIQDPTIVLRDGRLILAGAVPDVGAVASFHFEPAIDAGGKLHLPLRRVYAGRLPMPALVWTAQRERLLSSVRQRLPAWQAGARLTVDGVPNKDAVAAAGAKLLLAVMNDRSGDSVIFVPDPVENLAVPVRLTGVRLTDGQLSLTVEPITASEREAMLQRIRAPEPTATASAQ